MSRLPISLKRNPAMSVRSVSLEKGRLVYLLVCDKRLKYQGGKSRIAYIGTTKNGLSRVSQSVAARSEEILAIHGVRGFEARIVTCRPRQNVKTWHKLERAFLLAFRETYGEVPVCNSHGTKMRERNEFEMFSRKRIKGILEDVG